MLNQYIFVAGVPGSKWSSVVKNIYYSSSIDRSDYSNARTYYHSAWGEPELMHIGSYFDPGMEFGRRFMRLPNIPKTDAEYEFDRPFNGHGHRIIKSHVFCHHLEYIKNTWPTMPIVLVYRPNDASLGWWVKCGQFDITYPNYQYYSNLEMMAMHIDQQNADMLQFAKKHNVKFDVVDNLDLCDRLNIAHPELPYRQCYFDNDIKVAVI